MKRIFIALAMIATSTGAYAYYGHEDDGMSGFDIFTLIVMIVYIVLSIVILIRWWKMTENVEKIRNKVNHDNDNTVTYLIAIGEKEAARKVAIKMLADKMYPIYYEQYEYYKAAKMNKAIESDLPELKRLGIEIPDHLSSGEKFIDYLNRLTGDQVSYGADQVKSVL